MGKSHVGQPNQHHEGTFAVSVDGLLYILTHYHLHTVV